jgi:hypothetical protein
VQHCNSPEPALTGGLRRCGVARGTCTSGKTFIATSSKPNTSEPGGYAADIESRRRGLGKTARRRSRCVFGAGPHPASRSRTEVRAAGVGVPRQQEGASKVILIFSTTDGCYRSVMNLRRAALLAATAQALIGIVTIWPQVTGARSDSVSDQGMALWIERSISVFALVAVFIFYVVIHMNADRLRSSIP